MGGERLSRARAKELRKSLTDAENKLWMHLRYRQIGGNKFYFGYMFVVRGGRESCLHSAWGVRLLTCSQPWQHPVGPYIVDFACLEKGLVVEVDGGQHCENADYDSERSAYLESKGFRVLRFWNNEVLTQTEAVKEVIMGALC